jgi:hypothetical protein
MTQGTIVAICIAPSAGAPMTEVSAVDAIAGEGLAGDRYGAAQGSFSRGEIGRRQVTLINGQFFAGTPFTYADTRRNLVAANVELMDLIGREFDVGGARMIGLRYCDPCERPSKLSGKPGFRMAFFDRGGLVASVMTSGRITVGDPIVPGRRL